MKAIIRPKKIEVFEVYKVSKEKLPKILCAQDDLHQELLIENEQIILRETSREKNSNYSSTTDIDIYLNEGDLLIKLDKGYTKPLIPIIQIDKKLEKAINEINGKC
jgi:hypothetical protein